MMDIKVYGNVLSVIDILRGNQKVRCLRRMAEMSARTRFYDVWVWLKGHAGDRVRVVIETIAPLTPMNVRDYCCRRGLFLWKDYTRIKYRRVSRREGRK